MGMQCVGISWYSMWTVCRYAVVLFSIRVSSRSSDGVSGYSNQAGGGGSGGGDGGGTVRCNCDLACAQ